MDLVTQAVLPVLVGIVVWFITSRTEALRRERERLHDERSRVYLRLLEPYFHILGGKSTEKDIRTVVRQMGSAEYRTAIYELILVGSDDVVRKLNAFMQRNYRSEREGSRISVNELITMWGGVLLAIRRDLRNNKTKLTETDMLRYSIKDIDDFASP